MTNDDLDTFAEIAVATARDAGAILRGRFGHPHDVRFKGTIDMVTEADRAAEALIAERLRAAFPDHRLIGEEGARAGAAEADSPYRWVVDPLDGTTNYAHNLPTFAVSIGLEYEGQPIVGVVFDPMRDECFVAQRGQGVTMNGEPLRVSYTDDLIRALLVTGFSYDIGYRAEQTKIWRAFIQRVQAIRQTGSAALNLAYVAAGRLDGYWERGLAAWDVAAGALLVSEAGGTITGFDGGPFRSDNREVVASNGLLHPELLAIVADHAPLPAPSA